MDPNVKAAYRHELDLARTMYSRGQMSRAFVHLERAHILGQRNFGAHWTSHWWMLKIALYKGDGREVLGQLLRLLATIPGFIFGWVPIGNTGRSNVSAVRSMPMPDDLAQLLADVVVMNDVRIRVWIALAILTACGVLTVAANARHLYLAKQVDVRWSAVIPARVTDLGTVSELEIIPVVNWSANSDAFKTEPGVSYLVKTEDQTILFDMGFNLLKESPSPFEHNLSALGVDQRDIDSIFISHAHRDHIGGVEWEREGSFSFGLQQVELNDKEIYAPVRLSYPNQEPIVLLKPMALAKGIATTGPIPRQLFMGRIDEQALVINLKGKGLVVLVGCGHQTLDRLLALIEVAFEDPLYAIVGDLHYPVPEGRLPFFGIDAQLRFASGRGPFDPIDERDVEVFENTVDRAVPFIALGGHDTSDEVLERMEQHLGDRFQRVRIGDPISIL